MRKRTTEEIILLKQLLKWTLEEDDSDYVDDYKVEGYNAGDWIVVEIK